MMKYYLIQAVFYQIKIKHYVKTVINESKEMVRIIYKVPEKRD